MAKYVSRRAIVGIAKEAVRGTPVSPIFWIPWATLSFDSNTEIAMASEAMGNIQGDTNGHLVKKRGQGDIESVVNDNALGLLLSSTLGTTPVSTGSGNYTHTWSGITNTNQHQSLSIYISDPNFNEMFPLAMIDKFGFKVAVNSIVTFTISVKSRGAKDWATLTPNFTSLGSKYLHQNCQVKLAVPGANTAATSTALDSAPEIKIRSLEFNIDKSLLELDDVGTIQSGDINNQSMKISGSLEMTLEDNTYRDLELLETYKSMRIALVVSATNSLSIDLQRVKFTQWAPNRAIDAIALQKFNFTALYDPTNAVDAISQVILKNQNVSY